MVEREAIMGPTWESFENEGSRCVRWIERYFKDCVCTPRDGASFALGMLSLVFWAVAEIPQIITNSKNKSAQGVSLTLLLTWVVGDIFNLVGCLLEPATLPTQLYTALLYTAITVVLVLQVLYYDYYLEWRTTEAKDEKDSGDRRRPQTREDHPTSPIPTTPLIAASIIMRDMHYVSARSLANSGTPPYGTRASYLRTVGSPRVVKSGPPDAAVLRGSSSEDEEGDACVRPTRRGRRTTVSRSAGYGTFLAAAANLASHTEAAMEAQAVVFLGRKLLMGTALDQGGNPFGVWLGWLMAAIYMGGRLPQIILNIKRGSVEGLNPLMFLFALLANVTYVGSILVRTLEWRRIKGNAPWLLDAIACVLLDLLIIMQFGYYKFMHRGRTSDKRDDYLDHYVEVQKPQASNGC